MVKFANIIMYIHKIGVEFILLLDEIVIMLLL